MTIQWPSYIIHTHIHTYAYPSIHPCKHNYYYIRNLVH
uniref:Uncharacterized protein n=1 Tax=Arundo donax TaxID=35708 RepID=A0A0A9C4E8_ARUDO